MYINIPDGFELVTLTRNDLNYLREVTKNLEEMLADYVNGFHRLPPNH